VFSFEVLPSKYSGSVAARNAIWTRQSKTIFAGGKGFALPRLFFAGIWCPPRRRVRKECAEDSFLDFGGLLNKHVIVMHNSFTTFLSQSFFDFFRIQCTNSKTDFLVVHILYFYNITFFKFTLHFGNTYRQ